MTLHVLVALLILALLGFLGGVSVTLLTWRELMSPEVQAVVEALRKAFADLKAAAEADKAKALADLTAAHAADVAALQALVAELQAPAPVVQDPIV